VEPLEKTPTEPVDYALLTAAYGGLLGTLAYAARHRGDEIDPILGPELLPLGAATFALSKTLVHEKVESWVRSPFVVEGEQRRPKGRRLRYAVGELMTCTRCMGTWSALGLVALRLSRPAAGRTVSAVLAASAINDFLQTTFTWSQNEANRAGHDDAKLAAELRDPDRTNGR
jgi:Protein of unknown function (DUF1360)